MFKKQVIAIAKRQAAHVMGGIGYASLAWLASKGFSTEAIGNIYYIAEFIGSLLLVFAAHGTSAMNAKNKVKLEEKVRSYEVND